METTTGRAPSLVPFAVLRLSRDPRRHNWLCLGLAYRPRIMPLHALAYSPEDLFRHAHNR
ncbi:hypothetical protein ALC56_11894 [Trachymyrmex septentrionalis]|uniref:Uncharacterized protein n=1 Tax=Trachymyrmex septentrionalis TaxID=34720 RepID=A0A195F017_9HYME|nr:hypothetical protein ALC56_11894 [Trachymyrmex septentrionalis]